MTDIKTTGVFGRLVVKPLNTLAVIAATQIFIVLFNLTPHPASAMEMIGHLSTPGEPFPNRLYIRMTGEIVDGDAEDFIEGLNYYNNISVREIIIYLDSPGGLLSEAMRIADIIKSRPEIVVTRVGGLDDRDSFCASACVFIFAAGKLRYLDNDGHIGVHQFSSADPDMDSNLALSSAQWLSSEIISFLSNQGIAAAFFEEMASTSPSQVSWIDRERLEAWGVITGDVANESMEYININGDIALEMTQSGIYGANALTLTCNERHEVIAIANLEEPPNVSVGEFFAVIDGVEMAPASYKVIDRENYRTRVLFKLAPYQARLLAGAGSFGAKILDGNHDGLWGFEQAIHTNMVREMVNGCGGGDAVSPGLRVEKGVDLFGEDLYKDGIRNVTLQTCIKACEEDQRCVGISYVEANKWCWPKSSTDGRRNASGITSAILP